MFALSGRALAHTPQTQTPQTVSNFVTLLFQLQKYLAEKYYKG